MTDEELDALVRRLTWHREHVVTGKLVYANEDGPDAADAITTLRAQLADASTRIAAMESGDWSEVKLVRFENGQMDISAGPIPVIAEYLAQMMQDGEGKYFNYMEMTFDHKIAGPMTLSLQRKNGKTPNQLRKEAEARADLAEAERAAQIEEACAVIDAHAEYDQAFCCDGRECGCQGVSVHDTMKHFIRQPHDRTALDRMLAEARAQALREAAEMVSGSAYTSSNAGRRLEPVSPAMAGMDMHHATIADAILALIDSEQPKENMQK